MWQSLFINKVTGMRPATLLKKESLAQVFSCEFCEISKNTFLIEHIWLPLLYRDFLRTLQISLQVPVPELSLPCKVIGLYNITPTLVLPFIIFPAGIHELNSIRDHSFSMYANFCEKLIFLTAWFFLEAFVYVLNDWLLREKPKQFVKFVELVKLSKWRHWRHFWRRSGIHCSQTLSHTLF